MIPAAATAVTMKQRLIALGIEFVETHRTRNQPITERSALTVVYDISLDETIVRAACKIAFNYAAKVLDVDYLRQLSEVMAADWALRFFGDWHSHHRLGLSAPSGGDRRRIVSLTGRNQCTNTAESSSRWMIASEPLIRIRRGFMSCRVPTG
jgi:hypothetical protein